MPYGIDLPMASTDPLDQLGLRSAGSNQTGASADTQPDDGLPPPTGYGHLPGASESLGRGEAFPIARTQIRRDVFWQNVCREILMALAAAASHASGRLDEGPAAAQNSPSPVAELFDGRMGLITTLGQRIPIADVVPMFAYSMAGCADDRARSGDVQCTVFRITTPTGETYTLPITQIVGVHSLSASLIEQIEDSQDEQDDEQERIPFGFGAYTSLARSEQQASQQGQQQSQAPSSPDQDAPRG